MADGESVLLREVQGEGRLEVEFSASALPERGVGVGVEQRLVQTHYPGSNRAHTQVMGPKRKPITLRGKLRDTWLGAAGAAQATRARLERICDRGRLCELSWGETFVARGYLRTFDSTILRSADIDYELEFQVDASDEPKAVAPEPFPTPGPADLHNHIDAAATAARALEAAVALNNVIRAAL